jgi:hypothetical protein
MKRTAVLIAAVLAAVGCARSVDDPGALTVVPLDGDVRLLEGPEPVVLDEETEVDLGTLVATGARGRALLRMGPAGVLELGSLAQVRVDPQPEVVRGSVLARAMDPGLGVRVGGSEVHGSEGSVFRVDWGLSGMVAVYRGAAEILGSGIGPVPALRETTVLNGGDVPTGPGPLTVRPDHPWDIRLLGAAIDVGLDLDELQRGLQRQLSGPSAEGAVLRVLDEALPTRTIEDLLGRLDAPAETVVTAEVSRTASRSDGEPLPEVLDRVVDLRQEDAHWIVVVATWGLDGATLLGDLQHLAGVIERLTSAAALQVAAEGGRGGGSGRPAAGPSTEVGSLSGGPDSSGTATTGDTTGTASSGGSSGSGGSGSGGESSPPPAPGCNPVTCLVDDLVGQLDGPDLPGGGGGLLGGGGGGLGLGGGGGGGLGGLLP